MKPCIKAFTIFLAIGFILGFVLVQLTGCDEPMIAEKPTLSHHGEKCREDDDCGPQSCLTHFDNGDLFAYPGMCTNFCFYNDWCPEGFACLQYNLTDEGFCFERCETDDDCRDTWVCESFKHSVQACIPGDLR